MLPRHYIALNHKEPDTGFGVSFPDLPGVTAVADTLDEALSEASVALSMALEDWPGGWPLPRTLDDLRADREFSELAADAVFAAVAPVAETLAAE